MALLPWQQAAVLSAITVAVFSPTLSSGFVYDARLQILTDPFLHDPWNWLNVLSLRVMAMDVLDFNRPVNLASLMLDAAVWGKEPFGYHLTSVLLHAMNVVMVWGISRHLSRAAQGQAAGLSYFSALLFAVHPVVTEAVCEPTFREDLLATGFSLGALLLAMRRPQRTTANETGDSWLAAGCVLCCLLAVASKESGVAAPLILAVYWWLLRRGESGRFWRLAIGGGALVTAAFLAARFLLEPTPSQIFEAKPQYPGGSLPAALMIEPRILALYAQLIFIPINLCADYGLYSVRHLPLPVALAMLSGLATAAAFAIRADRRLALAVAMIVLPLVPVANLIPIYRAAADRYLYFPMTGVAVAVGLLLDSTWLASRGRLRDQAVIGMLAALAALSMACVERQAVWANPLSLWEDTYRKNPAAFTAASGLGEALREAGRLTEAEKATREAIRLSEGNRGDAWATLALILDGQGRDAEATDAIAKAIEVDPKLADPDARVRVLAMERPVAEALEELMEKLGTTRDAP
ncbi:MAG: tetratricopeptide repeat protein [Planctomycetota bacterium]